MTQAEIDALPNTTAEERAEVIVRTHGSYGCVLPNTDGEDRCDESYPALCQTCQALKDAIRDAIVNSVTTTPAAVYLLEVTTHGGQWLARGVFGSLAEAKRAACDLPFAYEGEITYFERDAWGTPEGSHNVLIQRRELGVLKRR